MQLQQASMSATAGQNPFVTADYSYNVQLPTGWCQAHAAFKLRCSLAGPRCNSYVAEGGLMIEFIHLKLASAYSASSHHAHTRDAVHPSTCCESSWELTH
jgi:hypothetical protein